MDLRSQSGSTVGTHACDASYGTTPRPRPVLCYRPRRSTTWMCQAAERTDFKPLYRPGLMLEAGNGLPAGHSGAASCFLRLASCLLLAACFAFCSALSVRSCTRLAPSVCVCIARQGAGLSCGTAKTALLTFLATARCASGHMSAVCLRTRLVRLVCLPSPPEDMFRWRKRKC